MARFKILLEYEGTRYSGWQMQKNARTIQGEIVAALRDILQSTEFELYGSGRTDAGVHALMQVAHLEAKTVLAPEILKIKLNDALPPDINILEIEKAPKDFHARHNAVSRSYLYQISRRRTAFGKRFVWWVKDDLDFHKMQKASKLFVGMKDYQSFTADDPEDKSTKVQLEGIEMREAGALILIRIVGSHFIWKMVRQIVGVLVEVGRGKLSVEDIERMFREKSDRPSKLTAPPSGLFLESVFYSQETHRREVAPVLLIDSVGRQTLHKS
jgi:tRNA pseudouridine38-40 synthase